MNPQQGSLLDRPITGNGRGKSHRKAKDTENAAAEAIRPKTGTHRMRILEAIAGAGKNGLTDWEIIERTEILRSTVCPRRGELVKDGYVRDSGERRIEKTGSPAIVWVATKLGKATAPHYHVVCYSPLRIIGPLAHLKTADRIANQYLDKHPEASVHVKNAGGDEPCKWCDV